MNKTLSKQEITNELWRRGQLVFKLDPIQRQLYDLYYNSNFKVQTWLLSRRAGKTYTLCILALEQCLRHPNSIVKFVAPTKLQINNIIRPILKQILEDCPQELKPEIKTKDYIYYFPNGSELQLAGTDSGHAEKIRGGDSHLALVDEAGSCSSLDDVVKSILLPTTLITKGKIILASTPPKEPDHDFLKYVEEAELRGSLVKKTVYDNPRITKEQLDELIQELGGLHTSAARRELLCEIIPDSNMVVIPEFTDDLIKEIVKEWPSPPFYDCYTSMDLGGQDLTVVLFGYFDFRADKVIIQDELVFNFQEKGSTLPKLVELIKEKESYLWYSTLTNELKKPYIRVSDINYIVTQEILRASHNQINFQVAKKDDNDSALNTLRTMLSSKKIIISPKCETLIRHLKNVKWYSPKNKTKFARSPDDGHYDAVDALKYLIRHIIYSKNPYPPGYGMDLKDLYIVNPDKFYNANGTPRQTDVYKKIFNVKTRN